MLRICLAKGIGEQIHNLLIGLNMDGLDAAMLNLLLEKIVMVVLLMKHKIAGKVVQC